MPKLRDLQLAFTQEVFEETGAGISQAIRANGLSGARRLQIYRNNMVSSLTGALQAVYPVIQRLVGEGFFAYAAHQYIHQHPSTSGNLHDFGCNFSEFLCTFEAVSTLTYLPDVAALEWAYHRVFHAAEHAPLDLTALAQIPQERHEELKFQLHPASRLLSSDYPILQIWQVNQDDYCGDQTVNLDQGGVDLLVIRRANLDIQMQILEAGEFTLLQTLATGHSFGDACEQALATQPDFDVPASFQKHVVQYTLVDFSL